MNDIEDSVQSVLLWAQICLVYDVMSLRNSPSLDNANENQCNMMKQLMPENSINQFLQLYITQPNVNSLKPLGLTMILQ